MHSYQEKNLPIGKIFSTMSENPAYTHVRIGSESEISFLDICAVKQKGAGAQPEFSDGVGQQFLYIHIL